MCRKAQAVWWFVCFQGHQSQKPLHAFSQLVGVWAHCTGRHCTLSQVGMLQNACLKACPVVVFRGPCCKVSIYGLQVPHGCHMQTPQQPMGFGSEVKQMWEICKLWMWVPVPSSKVTAWQL
jgi:hypothetical protein